MPWTLGLPASAISLHLPHSPLHNGYHCSSFSPYLVAPASSHCYRAPAASVLLHYLHSRRSISCETFLPLPTASRLPSPSAATSRACYHAALPDTPAPSPRAPPLPTPLPTLEDGAFKWIHNSRLRATPTVPHLPVYLPTYLPVRLPPHVPFYITLYGTTHYQHPIPATHTRRICLPCCRAADLLFSYLYPLSTVQVSSLLLRMPVPSPHPTHCLIPFHFCWNQQRFIHAPLLLSGGGRTTTTILPTYLGQPGRSWDQDLCVTSYHPTPPPTYHLVRGACAPTPHTA